MANDIPAIEHPVRIEDLPVAIPRPVQWGRLWAQIKIMQVADPTQVLDAAYSTGDAIGGMSEERLLKRILASEQGQALLASRPNLAEALVDKDALAAMPAGSLGRHFLAFSNRHQLDSLALLEHQHAMSRDYARLDPVRQYISDRLTVMHDVMHVIVGYDATNEGETALMCFSLPQRLNDRAIPLFMLIALLARRVSLSDAWQAFQRGKRAVTFAMQPFEELLPRPLAEVRALFNVTAPEHSHNSRFASDMLIPVSQ